MLAIGVAIGLGVWIFIAIKRSFFRVDEGHVAVLTRFGAAIGGEHPKTFGPGLHGKLPWDRPIVVSIMEQTLELSGQSQGRTAMASDGTVLRIDSILRYQPIEAQLGRFLFELRAPIEHITHLFTCLLRNTIANFDARAQQTADPLDQGGAYAVIRRERHRLNKEIEQMAREEIGDRYGVRFSAVDMTDILPPDELADALNAVIYARTDAEAHYFRAEADCRQRVIGAERGISIATRRAEAIETEIRTLGAALAGLEREGTLDDYVERRRAEVLAESRTLYLKEGR